MNTHEEKINYDELLVEATLSESIEWRPEELERYKSLQALVKYNDGVFKSQKQAGFILNTWAQRMPSDLEQFFGIPVDHGKKYAQVDGMYRWAAYGSRSLIPFWYIFELDDYGITRKWKVGAKGNLRDGASPDPEKVKLEFTRPSGVDTSHLEKSDQEKKKEFYKQMGGTEGQYLGTPGEKHDFGTVELVYSNTTWGDYGARTFQVLKDKDGNIIWYSGKDLGLDKGEKAHLRGKVKKHMVSKRQEKVTVILYPKVEKV